MSLIKDKFSREWMQVKEFCEGQLKEAHEDNERDLNKVETARLRGRIEFIKEILALGEDVVQVEVPKTHYIG